MSIHSQAFLGGYTHLFIGITVLFEVKRSTETILGFSRETKSIGNIYICVCVCVYIYIFQIYAFIIRNWILQYGAWKVPRSEVSKLRTQGNQCSRPNVGSLRTQENQMFQFEFRKKLMSHLESSQLGRVLPIQRRVSLFILVRPSTYWMKPTHIREGNLLNTVYKCLYHSEVPSQTYPK